MKQIFLALLLFGSFATYGQFKRGDKYLGGTFNIYTQRAPNSVNGGLNNVYNSFSFSPSVGFLLNEKFAVGGQLGYTSYYTKYTNNAPYIYERKSLSFTTGAFAKRYFMISDKFFFAVTGLVNYGRGTETSIDTNTFANTRSENKTNNYELSASLQPSFIFFPSPKWGFEASVGSISHNFEKNTTTESKSNFFNLNYGTFSLGLSYYFRKK